MKVTDLRSQLADLGGEHFLKPGHYMLASVVVILAGVSSSSALTGLDTLTLYLLANIISVLITAVPFMLLKAFKHQMKRDFNLVMVVLTGLVLGATKSSSTGWLVYLFGLESLDFALQSRLVSGTLIGLVVVLIASALPVFMTDFENKRALLIRESVSKKLADSVTPVTRDIVSELSELASGDRPRAEVSSQLELLVSEKLRPISKDLWESTAKRYPEFKLRSLVSHGFRHTPIPLFPMLVIYALGTSGLKQLVAGDLSGLWIIAIQSVGITAFILAANWLKKSDMYVSAFLLAGFGISVSVSLAPLLFELENEIYSPLPGFVLVAINVLVNIGLLTTLAAGVSERRRQATELSEADAIHLDLESEELSALLASRRAAAILHGQVQNRILGSAVKIGGGTDDYRLVISKLIQQLSNLGTSSTESTLEDALGQLVADWQGVIVLSYDIQGPSRDVSFNLIESIREGVTNAHKHGLASSVHLNVRFDAASIFVEISDDGLGPRKGRSGLGQRLLDALGPWKLVAQRQGGSLLSFVVRD